MPACSGPLGPELISTPRPLRSADAIVVLGNRPPRGPDGRIAPETERRIRRGAELYAAGLAPVLLVTGGPAPGGGTESEVMAGFARELGVRPAAILEETRARDTAENARFAIELLCRQSPGACHPRIILVTSPYHLRRATRLFECAGALVQPAPTVLSSERAYQAAFTAYEYAVRFVEIFDDTCARATPPP